MSLLKYLKEGMYEDLDNMIPEEDSKESFETDSDTPESDSSDDDSSPKDENDVNVDKKFVVRLVDYIDSKINLPAFGTFDDAILNEIRKVMDESDGKRVTKIKKKIHKIVLDEKKKFLEKIQHRVGKLNVPKKK